MNNETVVDASHDAVDIDIEDKFLLEIVEDKLKVIFPFPPLFPKRKPLPVALLAAAPLWYTYLSVASMLKPVKLVEPLEIIVDNWTEDVVAVENADTTETVVDNENA